MARIQRELVSRPWRNVCWLLLVLAAPSASHNVVERSAGAGGAGVYAETMDGQLNEVTSNGVIVSVKQHGAEREDEKQIEQYDESDWATIRKQLEEAGQNEDKDTADHPLRRRRSPSRQKRFMSGRSYTWPKGIVPFSWHPELSTYYTKEAEAAMVRLTKFTCIRFVPWVKGETKEKYGLADESHVEISKGNGCAAHQGNIRHSTGQYNSCCGRGTCTHELGHTLGLWHEHQSFGAAGFMQLDWNHIPADMGWTYRVREPLGMLIYQYDTSNTMHYGGKAFRVLYEDLRPLITFSNTFYIYKDVSLYHECKELHCSDFTQQCHNDGFVTLVDNVCTCLCPAGLDPATGCKTAIKQVTTTTQWPAGSYALLSPSNGCSDSSAFKAGSWTHKGKGGNSKSSEFHLAGSFDADSFRYEFCVKEDSTNEASSWEPGRYCIMRVGGTCPEGFDGGFIQFDDAVDSPKNSSGSLPDGVFAEDTRMEYCCRDDGFVSTPLFHIPNTQPLVMLTNQNGHCQEIAGMRWTKEYMRFDSLPEKANKSGSHPYVSSGTTFQMWFCHYVPESLSCGGEITLNAANRQAVITSQNYPSAYGTNEDCTWVIKAEDKGSRVLLNFDAMKITAVGGDCQDSLEIRYNLPGQPGIRFCGDGIGRTIRSLNDVVVMTLRTDHHQVTTDTGFSVTASLFVPEEEESFVPATKGKLYRGNKDYTRSMKPCLPWTKVTNCLHHAFKSRDFGAGLDKNYCRNPDDTAMPWCFTDVACNRDYCDVSNVERVYDRQVKCSSGTCELPRDQVLLQGCAAFCKLTPPPKPVKDQTCGKPDDLPDGTLVQPDARETYNMGDTVTYKCNTGNETLTRTCLSDGNFSPAGYVCGACTDGFAYRNALCYRYFDELVDFSTARSRCQALGAIVSSVKDKQEQDYVMSLRKYHWTIWTGATDIEEEGTFIWGDGTPLNWTNWEKGQPNDYGSGQDCVEMYDDGTFNDIACGYEFIGENKFNTTVDTPQYHTLPVPEGERIAVKTGDIIAVLYDAERLGVPYTFCSKSNNPESYNTYWYEPMTPGTAVQGKVYSFDYTGGSSLCRTFSMRAIVTQNPAAEDAECFDPATSGRLYRGAKDYTRSMKPCLSWTALTACPHHAFKVSDFGAGLDKNYCRNPDTQLKRPWCYTDQQCNREYCDVCNVESVTDASSPCPSEVCQQTREQVLAAGCAATCKLEPPPAPVRDQQCGPPGSLPDAAITPPSSQQTYSVGDTVTYTCNTGNETLTRTCLSDGNFSPAGYVCAATCADRLTDCRSVLLDLPDTCSVQSVFADQLCRYSCGLCQADATAECVISLTSGVELVSPPGAKSVARGYVVRYACPKGYILTEGKLLLACGADGKFIGELPVCTDPNTIVQDSNDVPIVARGTTTSSHYSYTSLGASLGITRTGVIKQWKFFSPKAGWSIFQVWRPNPAGGNFSFTLVGQNQIMTKGVGKETHDVPEADWIVVQPGDTIGLWEGASPRGYVPYDYCDAGSRPADHPVLYSESSAGHGDFSPVVATQFSHYKSCRTFSFKAVIHPISTLPASRQRVTSQVPVVDRRSVGAARNVYMTDAVNYHIPIDGEVSEWQFYVKHSGSGALQVWRPRTDLGTRKYELLGQNKVNLTISSPAFHSLAVPLAERIAVKKGDVIAVLYDRTPRLGVPYTLCSQNNNPESYNTYWYEFMTPDDAVMGKVYGFSYTGGSYLCRTFSMRAIVTPIPA